MAAPRPQHNRSGDRSLTDAARQTYDRTSFCFRACFRYGARCLWRRGRRLESRASPDGNSDPNASAFTNGDAHWHRHAKRLPDDDDSGWCHGIRIHDNGLPGDLRLGRWLADWNYAADADVIAVSLNDGFCRWRTAPNHV